MIIKLLLGIVFLVIVFWQYQKFLKLGSEQTRQYIYRIIFYGLIAAILLAVFTGRMHWLGAAFAAFLGIAKIGFSTFLRALPFLNVLRKNQAFSSPTFRTEFLEVKVNLNSTEIRGVVLSGPHEGAQLEELSTEELQTLEEHYQNRCKRSYYLIRMMRQRRGENVNNGTDAPSGFSSAGDPTIEESLLILGLTGSPSKKEIVQAHRSLIQKLHPDRGGNDYLASRINLAKDTLIKHFHNK